MNKLRILPGAAGIIALTATLGFVDGQREIEDEGILRDRDSFVSTQLQTTIVGASSGNSRQINQESSAYLVEIRHGEHVSQVLVDAVTGKILLS